MSPGWDSYQTCETWGRLDNKTPKDVCRFSNLIKAFAWNVDMQEKAKEQHLLVILAGGGYSYHPRWPATLQPPFWLAVTPICQVTHHLGQQWPSGRGSDGLHSINDISLWCGCTGMCPSSCFPLCRGKNKIRTHSLHVCRHTFVHSDAHVYAFLLVSVCNCGCGSGCHRHPALTCICQSFETTTAKAAPPAELLVSSLTS